MEKTSPGQGWPAPNLSGYSVAQFDIYPNPGTQKTEIPYLVSVQNDHITSKTGATVVIPLRANAQAVDIMAPLVEVAGKGQFVLSTDEIFAIDAARLRAPVATLSITDRAKIKPAVDKVIGEY
jgi:mRNA-degrading endonuclease toxin of MazEF toxin-antitoxin module